MERESEKGRDAKKICSLLVGSVLQILELLREKQRIPNSPPSLGSGTFDHSWAWNGLVLITDGKDNVLSTGDVMAANVVVILTAHETATVSSPKPLIMDRTISGKICGTIRNSDEFWG